MCLIGRQQILRLKRFNGREGGEVMEAKKFKIEGYLWHARNGEYSNYTEKIYLFKAIPDIEKMQEEVDQAWQKEPGHYEGHMRERIYEIVENHGGIEVPYIADLWTDGLGKGETSFQNNITGKEKEWPAKK